LHLVFIKGKNTGNLHIT